MSARLLLIALDGADGVLLDRWTGDGTLPNLAALRARGGARRLSAPDGITDDGLWASFQYAESLAEHGRSYWRQKLDSGEMGMAYLNEAGRESFWNALSNQGSRVGIIDVPKCGEPRDLNGIHLVDWLVHGRYFKEPKSYPASLTAEVISQFGEAPPSRCEYQGPALSDEEEKEVLANLRKSVAQKRDAGLHYLGAEEWDLFVIGFKEAHCAGHRYWNLVDPHHFDYDPERAAKLGDPLRTIFKDVDAAVGDLVSMVGPDTVIGVFSSSDFVPNGTMGHLMHEIARRMRRQLGETLITRGLRHLSWRCGAPSLIAPICDLLPCNENCGAFRVSPQGGFFPRTPGYQRRKARILERMDSLLSELVDADTGGQVITAIERPSFKYKGKRAAALPDLLVRFESGSIPAAVVSPRLGRIEADIQKMRPGNHAAGGFLIFAGDTFDGVNTMQDFGPMAARLLHPTSAT